MCISKHIFTSFPNLPASYFTFYLHVLGLLWFHTFNIYAAYFFNTNICSILFMNLYAEKETKFFCRQTCLPKYTSTCKAWFLVCIDIFLGIETANCSNLFHVKGLDLQFKNTKFVYHWCRLQFMHVVCDNELLHSMLDNINESQYIFHAVHCF